MIALKEDEKVAVRSFHDILYGMDDSFWKFFWAAFFFDFGFAIYFFLFNLYLLDLHFDERNMGMIAAAMTFGSVIGTLPAGWISRKVGLWPLLILCFILAPIFGLLRAVVVNPTIHIAIALLAGLAMCLWGMCFSPAIAQLTLEDERASGFSLIFSVSIGTSAIGGAICGYLPRLLRTVGIPLADVEIKRMILVGASLCAACGIIFIWSLKDKLKIPVDTIKRRRHGLQARHFLFRFLPAMGLWSAMLAVFTPFASVYLTRVQKFPIDQIGILFAVSQLMQLSTGLAAPWLFRRFGLMRALVATQILTAAALVIMAHVTVPALAAGLYLFQSAVQWMSSPGLYNLLMNQSPPAERSTTSSVTIFSNSLLQACASALTGICLVRYGYSQTMSAAALGMLVAAMLFAVVVAPTIKTSLSES